MTTLVTGSAGLVGYAIKQQNPDDTFFASREDANLIDFDETLELFERVKPTRVIHLAAQVAGIGGNIISSADYFRNNILININTLEAARRVKVKKLISFMSTCIFPDSGPYPLKTEIIHNGPPHPSNYGYAYAKRMLDIQSRAYRDQWNSNFLTVIPCNIYGPNDNFHLNEGHVIPSLIHKVFLAKTSSVPFNIWGDGSPVREFMFSYDVARITLWMLDNYNSPEPLIVAPKEQYSIREVAQLIAEKMGYDDALNYDLSKPNGQLKKPSDSSKFLSMYGDGHLVSLSDGLSQSIEWFLKSYPSVRMVGN